MYLTVEKQTFNLHKVIFILEMQVQQGMWLLLSITDDHRQVKHGSLTDPMDSTLTIRDIQICFHMLDSIPKCYQYEHFWKTSNLTRGEEK